MAQSPTYFVDHKRGEVNELKQQLRNPKIAKDTEKSREVIKKVLAYMTLGIDVSRLFSEMIMVLSPFIFPPVLCFSFLFPFSVCYFDSIACRNSSTVQLTPCLLLPSPIDSPTNHCRHRTPKI